MPQFSERMQKLERMLAASPEDPFLLYAIGLEHKKAGDYAQAILFMRKVLEREPENCAAYQQAGQIHELAGDLEAARQAYRDGTAVAARKGDQHARQEMEAALTMMEQAPQL